jgi:DNA polymerase IIIc chi subunit
MGTLFPSRGGSAHAIRNLARALPEAGWRVTVACTSVDRAEHPANAHRFYRW